jgi:hypothetical protein
LKGIAGLIVLSGAGAGMSEAYNRAENGAIAYFGKKLGRLEAKPSPGALGVGAALRAPDRR